MIRIVGGVGACSFVGSGYFAGRSGELWVLVAALGIAFIGALLVDL